MIEACRLVQPPFFRIFNLRGVHPGKHQFTGMAFALLPIS
jgi:hypothetical protein